MYPVKLGFDEAYRRAQSLVENGHHAEALVTAVFTIEKTLRRALRYAIVCRGFTSRQADDIIGRSGLAQLKTLWTCFVPEEAQLTLLLSASELRCIEEAAKMRNKLVHGTRAYQLSECRGRAVSSLAALCSLRQALLARLGSDGWSRLPVRRKAALTWQPPKPTA